MKQQQAKIRLYQLRKHSFIAHGTTTTKKETEISENEWQAIEKQSNAIIPGFQVAVDSRYFGGGILVVFNWSKNGYGLINHQLSVFSLSALLPTNNQQGVNTW